MFSVDMVVSWWQKLYDERRVLSTICGCRCVDLGLIGICKAIDCERFSALEH